MAKGRPAARISLAAVTPRQRGVRPGFRSIRYIIGVGIETKARSASRAKASVLSITSGGIRDRFTQWPRTTRP